MRQQLQRQGEHLRATVNLLLSLSRGRLNLLGNKRQSEKGLALNTSFFFFSFSCVLSILQGVGFSSGRLNLFLNKRQSVKCRVLKYNPRNCGFSRLLPFLALSLYYKAVNLYTRPSCSCSNPLVNKGESEKCCALKHNPRTVHIILLRRFLRPLYTISR